MADTSEKESRDGDGRHISQVGEPSRKKPNTSIQEKKKMYKAQLSYKSDWEKQYPWVQCKDPKDGMFCTTCIKWGNPPPSAKGGWTSRGIVDWNHATELLKQHVNSKWHKDAAVAGIMAQ